ncbi:MAG: hypothetical protein R6V62_09865 [Candidatus Fermentibacteraceae bacterium]
MGKTKVALLLCPVLSCGTGNGDGAVTLSSSDPASFIAGEGVPVTATMVESSMEPLFLAGTDQLVLDSVTTAATVEPGDTLARLRDPVSAFLESRITMEAALEEARGNTAGADSLRRILRSPPWFRYLISDREGLVTFPRTGTLLNPGDTVALISTALSSDSLWVLRSPIPLEFWPPVPGLVLTQTSPDTALAAGRVPSHGFILPGTWELPATALREAGLRIFVLTASGDSLSVRILGESQAGMFVYCEESMDSLPLVPWAARRE